MTYTKTLKKFRCARCNLISKRHDHLGGIGLCRDCDLKVGKEVAEARKLQKERKDLPERLLYLYESGHLRLDEN